jgi:hypothetical protein
MRHIAARQYVAPYGMNGPFETNTQFLDTIEIINIYMAGNYAALYHFRHIKVDKVLSS